MRRTRTGGPARGVVPMLVSLACAVLLALAPAAFANNPPTVSDGMVTPTSLPYTGGTVNVSAWVSDTEGGGVDVVWVEVASLGGWTSYALNRGASSPDQWVGDIELPPNLSGQPIDYAFTVVARDLDNAEGRGSAGTVRVAGGPLYDQAPSLTDPAVSPRVLPRTGGPVSLAVTATDETGLTAVYAEVRDCLGTVTRVPLQPVGGDRFTGVWNAPPTRPGRTTEYTVQLVAVDLIGNVGNVDAGAVTVVARSVASPADGGRRRSACDARPGRGAG